MNKEKPVNSTDSSPRKPTLELSEGPYYKPDSPEKCRLFERRNTVDKLTLTGNVLDINGQPIHHAWVVRPA
jgi:protocatechuate 3,4-dioxygenase beta subunit